MKSIINKFIIAGFGIAFLFSSCDKWTDTKAKDPDNLQNSKTGEYYRQLREYKKTDHPVAFGWFGNWTGIGTSLENSMVGIPDSVDFISMWGIHHNPGEERLKDLQEMRSKKGTKALMCFIVGNIGAQLTPKGEDANTYWGWVDGDDDACEKAVRKYARAILDTINLYNFDGFDIDYEPNYGSPGNIASSRKYTGIFVHELGKELGPKSGTDKLLVIDGEPQSAPSEYGEYFNYFIVQAYNSGGYTDLDRRLQNTINNYRGYLTPQEVAKKYIVTENFEDHALAGGVNHRTRDGRSVKSLMGMAIWKPIINGEEIQKGGVGTYHMEYEYLVPGLAGTYPYLRAAIQEMNPSIAK